MERLPYSALEQTSCCPPPDNYKVTTSFSYSVRKHTHTHPFNSPFSRTTQVSWYQKGRTNLDFTEARDSEWQWNQLGQMQVCTLLQTDNHASTPPLRFLKARCPSCCPTNSVKALKKAITQKLWTQYFSRWQKALFLFYTFSLK